MKRAAKIGAGPSLGKADAMGMEQVENSKQFYASATNCSDLPAYFGGRRDAPPALDFRK
jgi:hypothetical protein